MTKTRVFADTNVILEAFRTDCWPAISRHFAIETVQKCVEETLTGNLSNPRHIAISPERLYSGLAARHPVTGRELASLVLEYPSCGTLDDGEKHLLAWLLANKLFPSDIIVVTTADKAALVAIGSLNWLEFTVSLEYLARQADVARKNLQKLAMQYREDWLSRIKTQISLKIIP